MQLFQSFSEFLLQISGVKREQLECFADNCQTEITGKDLGNCTELCRVKYKGEFEIEHFKGDAALLLAHVTAWLASNDPYRTKLDLPDPTFEVDPVDRELVNIDISIPFEEPLIIRRNEEGDIQWEGESWSICPLDIDVATELESMDGKSDIPGENDG